MSYKEIEISEQQAAELALTYYNLEGELKKLPGEEDFNFYLKDKSGKEFTVKVSRPDTDVNAIDFQSAIMEHLKKQDFPLDFPEVIHSTEGKAYVELDDKRFLRVQKWVPGRMLSEVNPRTPALLENWGAVSGLCSRFFADFDHPAAHRFYKWNPSETLFSKQFRQHIHEQERLEIADYFWNLFEEKALPKLAGLRKSVNYNDAHEHNLLVNYNKKNPLIRGIIDFGDALYTETVNELAIAAAYAGMYMPDPLQAIAHVVKGYHKTYLLKEEELEVLFPLIGARLMITASNAAFNKHNEPDNEYLLISEKPAWDLLEKLRAINPDLAHYTFRAAAGFEPCAENLKFQSWFKTGKNQLTDIINVEGKVVVDIDLSVGSPDLGNNSNFETPDKFERRIRSVVEDQGADYAQGGYAEARPFYSTDAYMMEGNNGPKWRTVHIGHDFCAPAGTAVFAPMDGTIHSFQNNDNFCDYGPTIILEHKPNDELVFYTLYGHLSLNSIQDVKIGDKVKKGQQIASIGDISENGHWPPHLHFQVMLDMLGMKGDFPGACFPEDKKVWMSISPDATLFFQDTPATEQYIKNEKILASRKENLGKSLSISYDEPLHMVRGYKQYLYDVDGKRYLDTVNNVPHVGHQHPRVVNAAKKQIELLNTNTRYLHENIVKFAEELLETFPPELSVVHFVNSGSEANELAMRMVEAHTGQKDMIAVEVGYHGNTGGCISISSYKFDGKGGKGAPEQTQIVPIPDTYRGLYRNDPEAGRKYGDHLKTAVDNVQSSGRNVGAFICESIISCGGQIVLPENYLKTAYKHVRDAGGICISDEVQVGFGRVGDHFWGFEYQDVVPDIVTLGKPIGNGHPLAAVVTTKAVAESFANGMEYFNTFGGNPVSCAIGREVLAIIKEEKLQENAKAVGAHLTEGLKKLQEKFPIIGDVRGPGLFLGFELVKNRESIEPAAEEAAYLANRMKQRGILMSTDGPFYNVLKIKPPICFTKADADFLLENLEVVLKEDFLKIG